MSEPTTSNQAYASWIARVAAVIADSVPIVILFAVLAVLFGTNETSSDGFSFQLEGVGALLYFAGALGWFVYNWLVRQGGTGQTVGKKALGIGVFKAGTAEPLGAGLTFARQLAHILDSICLIGYLFPLVDKENRTFADMVMGSRAYKV